MTELGSKQSRTLTRAKQRAFLAAFRKIGTIKLAADASGIGRSSHYDWMAGDAVYKASFEKADEDFVDRLESEAIRRALHGTAKGIYYQGLKVATEKDYSNDLLALLLKARRPALYKDRRELTGAGGEPLIPADVSEQVSKWLRKVAGQEEPSTNGHKAELGATIVEPAGAES
jgi:hypothetical protein